MASIKSGGNSSTASGNRCKNAPPIIAPAESDTNSISARVNLASLIAKVKTPAKAPKLITPEAKII